MGPLENIENTLDGATGITGAMFGPSNHGLLTWAYDPMLMANAVGGTGSLLEIKVAVPNAATCTGIVVVISIAGATLTSGQNKACLWSPADTQVGITADQSTLWTSTGAKTMPFAAGTTTINPGVYTIGLLSVGSSAASFVGSVVSNNTTNAVGNGAGVLYGHTLSNGQFTFLSGQTTLPSTRPTGTSFVNPVWAALY
jgi:hypothetical protein